MWFELDTAQLLQHRADHSELFDIDHMQCVAYTAREGADHTMQFYFSIARHTPYRQLVRPWLLNQTLSYKCWVPAITKIHQTTIRHMNTEQHCK